jgi:ABC-type sugar transport system ATPase subunit
VVQKMTGGHAGSRDASRTRLQISGVTKRFAGAVALSGASMSVRQGCALALVGENGAGKSTLIKIISGAVAADKGEIVLSGDRVNFATPQDAAARGVATVYQELSLFPDLTVAENLVLGGYPKRCGLIRWSWARDRAIELFDQLELSLPVDVQVRQLGLAERYLVEIAKALRKDPQLLILDEPTAALDAEDSERIFRLMATLRARGTSLIFVSHRLQELFATCQQYMVLRDGLTVDEGEMSDTNEDDLVAKMLSSPSAPARAARSRGARPSNSVAAPIIKAVNVATHSIRNLTIEARPGDVIGIAGLRGSGQSAFCRALTGADRIISGHLELDGALFRPRSPSQALKHGVTLVPVDRKTQGLFSNLSVAQNVAISRMAKRSSRFVTRGGMRELAREYRQMLDIRLPEGDSDVPVTALSGGNQQKVVLARCLASDPAVLVLDEPTRGVDVGAHRQIHDLITQLAGEGLCVLLSSSALSELLSLCTSIAVLHRGEMVAELSGDDMNEHDIIKYASGVAVVGS